MRLSRRRRTYSTIIYVQSISSPSIVTISYTQHQRKESKYYQQYRQYKILTPVDTKRLPFIQHIIDDLRIQNLRQVLLDQGGLGFFRQCFWRCCHGGDANEKYLIVCLFRRENESVKMKHGHVGCRRFDVPVELIRSDVRRCAR